MLFKLSNRLMISGAFLVTVYILFVIKDIVTIMDYRVIQTQKQIVKELNKIHVLKTEFSLLTSPERLKQLSSKYLNLELVKIDQMIKDPITQEDIKQSVEVLLSNEVMKKNNRKCRYKKVSNKYL